MAVGGNAGATDRNDFELFNRGTSPVNLTGWSVQYDRAGTVLPRAASAGGLGSVPPLLK